MISCEAMGDAAGALGEGNSGRAVDGQGRALDAMRKGAQGLAQQLQQQMGQGQQRPPAPASLAAWVRRGRSRKPIRWAGRCAGAITATTPR
jgi:Domain of unknown function (DUF4175)